MKKQFKNLYSDWIVPRSCQIPDKIINIYAYMRSDKNLEVHRKVREQIKHKKFIL